MAHAFWIVLVIILIWLFVTGRRNEDYLYGCWTAADNEFTDAAEIDSAMLFIGKPSVGYFSTHRLGYIVLTPDMYNGGIELKYSNFSIPYVGAEYSIRASVTFDEEPIWDPEVTITVNILKGTLKIHNGDTVFMRLSKQHDITNTAEILEDE